MNTNTKQIGLTGSLCLTLLAGLVLSTSAQEPQAGPSSVTVTGAAVNAEQYKILEGEGWNGFRVGATREQLIAALGEPDSGSSGRWLKWQQKYFVHCLVDDTRGAFELRFDQGFPGSTSAGIKIGSSLADAMTAYGEPSSKLDNGAGKKLIWDSRGILIWFKDNKVNQLVVFAKK